MNTSPKTLEQKFHTAAKLFAASFYLSFFLSAAVSMTFMYSEARWKWIAEWKWLFEVVMGVLIRYAFLALTINLLMPCLLILIFPALGYAWLRGFNRSLYSYKPWKEVPDGEAFLSLLGAMLSFCAGAMIFYVLVINGMFGETLTSFVAAKVTAGDLWLHQP